MEHKDKKREASLNKALRYIFEELDPEKFTYEEIDEGYNVLSHPTLSDAGRRVGLSQRAFARAIEAGVFIKNSDDTYQIEPDILEELRRNS